MALPACHTFVQFYVADNKLSCKWTQRSVDTVLGLPYNIVSYALLTHILAKICNMEVGNLVADLGDTHIYENHFEAVKEQLQRDPNKYELPILKFDNEVNYWDSLFEVELGEEIITTILPTDFYLENYQHYLKLENLTPLNTGLV